MAPFKLAIIGAGPSAFYTASRILSRAQKPVQVHMYDRLWAPHGLVRYGVAPDHPEVKNCTHKFDEVGADPRFRFFGNVNVSGGISSASAISHNVHLPLPSLLRNYSHLLYASGCTLPTLHHALPPSQWCIPALSFVHWYTAHPSAPAPPPLDKLTHVTLIGNGNVSLDIARMLLASPSSLAMYDIPERVMEVLKRSTVKHVSIVARRGPLEAAFTVKELRELMNLEDAAMAPLAAGLLAVPEGTKLSRQQTRMLKLLEEGSAKPYGSTSKTWSLDFFREPVGLAPPSDLKSNSTSGGTETLATLSLAHTALSPSPTGAPRAVRTGETSTLNTSLVITSLGFHADPAAFAPTPSASASSISPANPDSSTQASVSPNLIPSYPYDPYDPALGHLRTLGGRVVAPTPITPSPTPVATATEGAQGAQVIPRTYASGWAACGARGVIASTMMDAYNVADTILSDLDLEDAPRGTQEKTDTGVNSPLFSNASSTTDELPQEIVEALARGEVTQYMDWKAVDVEEVRRGQVLGKERERMSWEGKEGVKAFLGR